MYKRNMIAQKQLILLFITYVLTVYNIVTGYPIANASAVNMTNTFDIKDETRYPNGTIVGEFSYTDDDGNPINVKYYADEFNYGVELKSAKVIGPGKGTYWKNTSFITVKKTDDLQQTTGKPKITQDDDKKKLYFKNVRKSADYETFYRNDIKGLNQCDKDKVRVYLDREKKIIKRALEHYQGAKSCGRY